MSALSYLGDYGSNSEGSDAEVDTKLCKSYKTLHFPRAKLPTPNLSQVPVIPKDVHEDNPILHGGRTRSFPHERGNWATFVFVQYLEVDVLYELLDKLEAKILSTVDNCQRCDDFHISLSKTVVLKYHMISAFSSSLQKILKNIKSFDLGFSAVKVYCNEEKSRTFISLAVDSFTQKFLLAISKKVDQVLEEFQFSTFYKDPSFHMSIFWVNGDKESELSSIVESMNDILYEDIEKSLKTSSVDSINCKIGNKSFRYPLS